MRENDVFATPTAPSAYKAAFSRVDRSLARIAAGPAEGNQRQPCHTTIVHQRIQRATEEVKRVEHDLRRQTVQKAAQEIDKIAELSDGKQECLLDLLTAVAARWRGMLPVFSQIAEQRSEIVALQNRLRATERARDEAVAQTAKAEEIATNAVQTTEIVHKALGESKAEVVRLEGRIQDLQKAHKRELDDKQEVLSRLHDTLKALKEKACPEAKQKQEIEKLREQAKASAELELQHERALSQMVVLDGDEYEFVGYGEEGAQQLHLNNVEPRFSQLEGSQATIERVSAGSSGKRKGSEDDLLELGENGPPKHDINCLPAGSPLFKKRTIASSDSRQDEDEDEGTIFATEPGPQRATLEASSVRLEDEVQFQILIGRALAFGIPSPSPDRAHRYLLYLPDLNPLPWLERQYSIPHQQAGSRWQPCASGVSHQRSVPLRRAAVHLRELLWLESMSGGSCQLASEQGLFHREHRTDEYTTQQMISRCLILRLGAAASISAGSRPLCWDRGKGVIPPGELEPRCAQRSRR
ncbi:hypothetical protein NUW54_g8924 [Trametes sanguinea]|uniref:Uncharacterized protein n=1 Tax=Trametes sanguinea TaxID=158606 RepID=A0ACC1PBI4_9APHY|nr:hypothetical protein NUW54_g8924 [Trametes sanguinea]